MLIMTPELVGVASIIVMFLVMCFTINMNLAVIAACEHRALAFPVQVTEMEEQQSRESRGAAERRRPICRHMEAAKKRRRPIRRHMEAAEKRRRPIRRHVEAVNLSAGNRPQEHDERLC